MQRGQRVLAVAAAVALLAAGAYVVLHRGSAASDAEPVEPKAPASAPATVLRPDQLAVNGTGVTVHAVGAEGSPVSLPITITVPVRGAGQVVITRLAQSLSVAWGGGQPLPLTGRGTLDLGPVTIDADAGGVTWHLDGRTRFMTPGEYTLGSPVGVSSPGALPVAHDSITVVVDAGTEGELVSAGDAQFRARPRALNLTGPGRLILTGSLTMRAAGGTRAVRRIEFGPGAFQIQLTPGPDGYTVSGLLQGPVAAA